MCRWPTTRVSATSDASACSSTPGGKRELWKDLFVSLSVYNTYDSRPPNPAANNNDVGIVTSIGWTY